MAMNPVNAEKGTACKASPDVSENIWYYGAVAGVQQNTVGLCGYPDGTGPERNITRGEVASIINRGGKSRVRYLLYLENG